jgi:tRNA (guanine37-N1)-methyltransferase
VIADAVSRLIPGVLGDEASPEAESFSSGLLEYPQYTRPADYRGYKVPEVLLSGNHAEIEKWRREMALKRTLERRPDLLENAPLNEQDRRIVAKFIKASDPEED